MPKTITGKIKLKKPTRHTALSLVALILWCTFIFYMSARVAQDSDALSLGFAGRFLHLVVPGFSDMSAADQLALAKSINHPVRKLAHFCEFAALGFFTQHLWAVRRRVNLHYVLHGLFFGLLCAVTDEMLQTLSDRSAQVSDVVLDFSGVVCGSAVFLLLYLLIRRHRR